MLSEQEIQNIINTIVEGYKPEKNILFGSYVNGNITEDSDLDIAIK
jgi:predicted nucleotidyltransferase